MEELKNSIYNDSVAEENFISKTHQNFHQKMTQPVSTNPSNELYSKMSSNIPVPNQVQKIKSKEWNPAQSKFQFSQISAEGHSPPRIKELREDWKVVTKARRPTGKSNSMIPNPRWRNHKLQYQSTVSYQNGSFELENQRSESSLTQDKKSFFSNVNIVDLPQVDNRAVMHIEITPSHKKYLQKESKIWIKGNYEISKVEVFHPKDTRNPAYSPFVNTRTLKTNISSSASKNQKLALNFPVKSTPVKISESKNLFAGALSTVYKDSKENRK